MNKKDINPVNLINYYKLINHNLIYNNKAINRYKKDTFEISGDKAESLEKLKKSILEKDTNLLFSSFERTRNVRKRIIDAGQDENKIDFGRKNK